MSFLQRIFKKFRPNSRTRPTDPESVAALKLIEEGQTEERAGRLEEARLCYEKAVAAAPGLAKAHMNLGNAHLAMRCVDEALKCYEVAVQLDTKSATAHYNLGNAFWHMNRTQDALRSYLTATDLDQTLAAPWIAIANTLAGMEKHSDAIDACNHALLIEPDNVEAHVVLSMTLKGAGRLDESIDSMRRAVALREDHPFALTSLANSLEHAFRFSESQACYRRATQIAPRASPFRSSLLYLLSQDEFINPEELYREHIAMGDFYAQDHKPHVSYHENSRLKNRVIRIGFVSADLRTHAVLHFIEPIFRAISNSKEIKIYIYYNYLDEDQDTKDLQAILPNWRNVATVPDDDFFDKIKNDQIDILIDLSGHTSGNRLPVFSRKPAPIQASWIGYPGTTGLRTMDYYFADRHFLPNKMFSNQFTEKLIHLPSTAPFIPFKITPPIGDLPAIKNGFITFGSFNRPSKIRRRVVHLWARILKINEKSRMIIAGVSDDYQVEFLKRWFSDEGIDLSRLSFQMRMGVDKFLRIHHDVDLCLDTFPYTGGTTTRHALWMGVPTITMAGSTPASRQASSIMELMGLDDFVASTEDDLVSLAQNWANRLDELANIRMDMRNRFARSPLGKPELVASAFVKATRIMWQRWCSGEPPEFIDVSEP